MEATAIGTKPMSSVNAEQTLSAVDHLYSKLQAGPSWKRFVSQKIFLVCSAVIVPFASFVLLQNYAFLFFFSFAQRQS